MNKSYIIKKNWRIFVFSLVLLINILLTILRFYIGDYIETFNGNLLSVLIFLVLLSTLLFLFLSGKYDYFILLWLSFYFASPIIVLPFSSIGILGILSAIFIPLIFYKSFELNKYLITISIIFFICILHVSDVGLRIIFSRMLIVLVPLVFFNFVLKRSKDIKLIMWGSIFITLINVPLAIYEIIFHPSWGTSVDWRGFRIFGNLFWHNSYSFYLIPPILSLYALYKESSKKLFIFLMLILIIVDIFTFSRGGLLSLIISLTVFELMSSKGMKSIFKGFIIFLAFLILIIAYITTYNSLDSHLNPYTISERTSIWESITPFLKENLVFGNGLGSYEVFRANFLNELSSHNLYLFILFELGIIGLLLFLVFVLFIFSDLKKRVHLKSQFKSSELGFAILAGALFYSFVGNDVLSLVVSLNMWVLLACCVKYNEKN
jgi:O-antigen ligase